VTQIHKEVYGQGRPLVLLHGWAMHSGVWRNFAQQLAQYRQVICMDLPGHGRSKPLVEFDLESVADALFQAINLDKFSVLGWSLGGLLAIEIAHRYPQHVAGLHILASNPKFVNTADWVGVKSEVLDGFANQLSTDTRQTLLRFLALQVNGLPDGKQLLQELKKAIMECDAPSLPVLQQALVLLKQSDLRSKLQQCRGPVALIQGDKDHLAPLAGALAMLKMQPAIKLHVLEGAGHAPFLSHRQQLLALLQADAC
jgi:pimeloyl-[acyl-carrier protein] methyl ester esterase